MIKKVKKPHAGFLLLEITIVLAVIITCSIITYSAVSLWNGFILRQETEKIYIFLKAIQQQALYTQKAQKVYIAENNLVHDEFALSLHKHIKTGYIKNTYGPPSNPTEAINKPISFINNTIHFYPDGTISSGIIYLVDAAEKYMHALTIPVGAVCNPRLYVFQDATWTHYR